MNFTRKVSLIGIALNMALAAPLVVGVQSASAAAAQPEVVELKLESLPKDGERDTVRLTLRNPGQPISVEWSIREVGIQTPLGGGRVTLAQGTTNNLTAAWTAHAGQHVLQGTVKIVGIDAQPMVIGLNTNVPAGPVVAGISGAQRTSTASLAKVSVFDANSAKIDSKNFKEDIKSQTANTGITAETDKPSNGRFADLKQDNKALPQGKYVDSSTPSSGASKALTDAVGGKLVITGGRYGDTFGADRVNGRTTFSANDVRAGGKGNASDSDSDVMVNITSVLASMIRAEGGNATGIFVIDMLEATYMQKAGTDGYAATKNMDWLDRFVYWQQQTYKQKSTPIDTDMSSGQWRPVTRSDVVNMLNTIKARLGRAGGRESQSGGGFGAITRGKDDAPAIDRAIGRINIDAVLAINQKVNPTRL